jgi:biopolymer transport protein ExbD
VRRAPKPIVIQPASPKSEINVTPLVDVVLVLLIIFMVIMPLLENELNVKVPANDEVASADEVPPDQIVVAVSASGGLSINGTATPDEGYVAAVAARLEGRKAGERVVFVNPQDDAPYPRLVDALEGARRAGAQTLGMLAEPIAGEAEYCLTQACADRRPDDEPRDR